MRILISRLYDNDQSARRTLILYILAFAALC